MKLEILNELAEKEVLLTGGCGFIGSEVTKQLSNLGSKITIIDAKTKMPFLYNTISNIKDSS